MRERHSKMAEKRASDKVKSHRVFGQRRKQPKMFRAGLYARVSTTDQQTIPLQIRTLREYAARRGWTITLQVKEVGSGAAQRQLREKLLEAARRREIDVVLVWRLDLSRLSWKWRERSPVKITERTREKRTEALHGGREGRHPEAAFGGEGADLEAL